MNTIGKRLSYVRKNILNKSQQDFAMIIGSSQGALSEMEKDNRGISIECFIKLIDYSKSNNLFSADWILTGSTNSEITNKVLANDEVELLNIYNQLDSRGQHRLHTVGYEELERMEEAHKKAKEKDAHAG